MNNNSYLTFLIKRCIWCPLLFDQGCLSVIQPTQIRNKKSVIENSTSEIRRTRAHVLTKSSIIRLKYVLFYLFIQIYASPVPYPSGPVFPVKSWWQGLQYLSQVRFLIETGSWDQGDTSLQSNIHLVWSYIQSVSIETCTEVMNICCSKAESRLSPLVSAEVRDFVFFLLLLSLKKKMKASFSRTPL